MRSSGFAKPPAPALAQVLFVQYIREWLKLGGIFG